MKGRRKKETGKWQAKEFSKVRHVRHLKAGLWDLRGFWTMHYSNAMN